MSGVTPDKPEFADNQTGNTMAAAIRARLSWLRGHLKPPLHLDIASGYFNPEGFLSLADELETLDRVRILLGAEVIPADRPRRRKPGEPRGPRYIAATVHAALASHEKGLRDDLDLLGFDEESHKGLERLVRFLRSGKVEVRRYEQGFLHGKAFIFADNDGVLAGSSNFTAAGLNANIELNIGQYQPHVVSQVRSWYDGLWTHAAPYDLASLYEARFRPYPPYWIYLRALLERYRDELQEEQTPDGRIPLTTFQNDGLQRARRILERYNGVLIADGVGLGKSFLAGELLRETVQDHRQRALLVSPAALRDGTWQRFKERHQLYLENVSFEQLAADPRLRGLEGATKVLKDDPDRYALVVVDEAHALRNPDTERARALRALLRGNPPKKLVLLTATPVNNSLWDLYYLLLYFVGHDAAFAHLGVPSLKQRFGAAAREDPESLSPDLLFDLLDEVTVRRTRNFVRRNYPHEKVRVGREEIEIRFPTPRVRRIDYAMESAAPGLFDELRDALDPPQGPPRLTMARYVPSAYLKRGSPEASQQALAGLLRSAILKRFESSVYAFACTCEAMAASHNKFLDVLSRGLVPTRELMTEWGSASSADKDLDDLLEELGPEATEPVKRYKIEALRRDVEADRDLLLGFATRARKVTHTHDPKLASLVDALAEIVAQAAREALSDDHARDLRKVLVFSYFADTTDWIQRHLDTALATDKRLKPFRGRMAVVSGREPKSSTQRTSVVQQFAPRSTEAPDGTLDAFDVLVCTDVLAEGLNLQQCHHIINYDLPWNPMRLVQRHGRIDRIGSPHEEIFIACFFPTERLEDMLRLERRLRDKLAQAAASVGVEDAPIPDAPTGDVVFADTEAEIERLRQEDAEFFVHAGEDPASRSGEEYRQELRRGMESHRHDIEALPYGAGSGLARGLARGHFFCIRVLDRVFFRFVPLDATVPLLRDTLRCLRVITCAPETERVLPDDLATATFGAWKKARQDVFDEWMRATDPANLQPPIRRLFHVVAEHLRVHPPSTLTQAELEEAIEAIMGPWGLRIEREVRDAFSREGTNEERSLRVIDRVRALGLQPYRPPPPLDEVDENEVMLVCWMAVEVGTPKK